MRLLDFKGAVWTLFCALALVIGCSRTTAPPDPIPAAELPAAVEKAFGKAKPEIQSLARQVVSQIQAQDYTKAFASLQALAARPELTKEQADVASRTTLTLNGLLQEAQAKGDAKAAQTLQKYRHDK